MSLSPGGYCSKLGCQAKMSHSTATAANGAVNRYNCQCIGNALSSRTYHASVLLLLPMHSECLKGCDQRLPAAARQHRRKPDVLVYAMRCLKAPAVERRLHCLCSTSNGTPVAGAPGKPSMCIIQSVAKSSDAHTYGKEHPVYHNHVQPGAAWERYLMPQPARECKQPAPPCAPRHHSLTPCVKAGRQRSMQRLRPEQAGPAPAHPALVYGGDPLGEGGPEAAACVVLKRYEHLQLHSRSPTVGRPQIS